MDNSAGEDICIRTRESFYEFLKAFKFEMMGEDELEEPFYVSFIRGMKSRGLTTIFIEYEHLQQYNQQLAEDIIQEFYRLEPHLRKAAQQLVREVDSTIIQDEDSDRPEKEIYVAILNLPSIERLRDLKTTKIGKLVSFSGCVTRTSEVRPELFLGAFRCLNCSTIIRGVEQQFRYTQPLICSNPTCGNRDNWSLVHEDSTFVDWQRVKVQENANEVPGGSLPRTLDVILRNDIVENAKPGDKVVFTGSLIVVPDVSVINVPGERVSIKPGNNAPQGATSEGVSGLKSLGVRELTYRLMFVGYAVQATDEKEGAVNIRSDDDTLTPESVINEYGENDQEDLLNMRRDPLVYSNMAKSLAPTVYGHDHIKQAILLMLFGGVHKTTPEGINLRGDINVAIIGDPSCAKSQLLKYVSKFLPRAVYTSGKASTAAGLTASVVKEPENNEFAIEAGALMLADNGICCIDEFDKMDVKDQVAIHEAMEQQTISIAKAGIQATLNARASVLAAANPIGGRYDKSKPLKYNIALPPAILSRFDLLHVMLDETTEDMDEKIARHILDVHRYQERAFHSVAYSMEQIQRYIRFARSIKPMITPAAQTRLVKAYKELRGEDAAPGTQSAYRITVRQLEALIRLSEAMARVYCDVEVQPIHVDEAKKLLRSSIMKIEQSDVELDEAGEVSRIPQEEDLEEQLMDQDPAENNENVGALANGVSEVDAGVKSPTLKSPTKAVGTDSQPAKKPAVKVTASKYEFVKALLVKLLRDHESKMAARAEGLELEPDEDEEELAGGMTQQRLITKYVEHEIWRQAVNSEEEMEQETMLVTKIISHLINKEGVLLVVSTPPRQEGEGDAEYRQRAIDDRVLALQINYVLGDE